MPVRPNQKAPSVLLITPQPCWVVFETSSTIICVFFLCYCYGQVKKMWVFTFYSLLFISCGITSQPTFAACHITVIPMSCSLNYWKCRKEHAVISSKIRNISCTPDIIGTNQRSSITLWDRFHQAWLLCHHHLSWTCWLNGTENCFALPGRNKSKPKPSNSSSIYQSCAEEQRHSRYFLACPEPGNGSASFNVHLIPCFQTQDRYSAKHEAVSASRRLEPPRNMYI